MGKEKLGHTVFEWQMKMGNMCGNVQVSERRGKHTVQMFNLGTSENVTLIVLCLKGNSLRKRLCVVGFTCCNKKSRGGILLKR